MSAEGPPIDLARYAEVKAHLGRFPADKSFEVLARLGLRRGAWQAAEARWEAAREAEIASGKADLTVRFGAVFARTRRRLEAQGVSLESLGPLPGPDEPEPAPAPPPPPPAEVAPPVIQLISAQLAPPQPAAPSFLVGQAARYEAPAVVTAPPAPAPVSHPLNATLPLGTEAPIARMPFREAAAPEQAFAAARAHAAAVQGPPPSRRDPSNFGSTVGVSSDPLAPALPFGGPADSRRDPHNLGGTVGPSSDPLSAALPFQSSAPPGVADLTMAQYASLRVELQTHPDRAAAILGRYGVPPDGRAALEAHWRARFGTDPLLRMEFARAYAAYTAWLRSNPG